MNLIGPKPHFRRELCLGIPQMFGSRSAEHRGSTELCWGGSDCAYAAAEPACSSGMHVRSADARFPHLRSAILARDLVREPFELGDMAVDIRAAESPPAAGAPRAPSGQKRQ
jgi:hypothetical protein